MLVYMCAIILKRIAQGTSYASRIILNAEQIYLQSLLNPLDAMGICLNKQKLILAPSIMTPIQILMDLMETLDTFMCPWLVKC